MRLFGSKLDKGLDAFQSRSWKRARRLLHASLLEDESATAAYHLGLLYWRGLGGAREPKRASDCFAIAADRGHAAAQTALGVAFRAGVGAPKNNDAARQLFRSAMGAGDVDAMAQLATMSDPDEARRLLIRAAEKGHTASMRHLADLLATRDPVEALSWLYTAVSLSGDEASRKRAKAIARELTAKEIDEAQKAGRAYAKNIQRELNERR